MRTARVGKARWSRAKRRDAGSISVFVASSMLGLLLIIGLVADGGLKVRAAQQADAVAAEAARAAGQAIDASAAVGGQVHVDARAAADAALAFLAQADAPGTVQVSPDGLSIEVAVTVTRPTAFLSLIGVTQMTVTGRASATLVHSVTGAEP